MYPKSVPEEVAHAVDSNQIINLEDWSINFNEFQRDGIKQLKSMQVKKVKATKTREMIAVTTWDVINMCHHIQTRRIHIQSSGILSHLCSLTLWIAWKLMNGSQQLNRS
jgi:hypothetical protein